MKIRHLARVLRSRVALLGVAALAASALVVAAPPSLTPSASASTTTLYKGAFQCNSDGQRMAGAKITVYSVWQTWLPYVWPNVQSIGSFNLDSNGAFAFNVQGNGHLYVEVSTTNSNADLRDFWSLSGDWSARTATRNTNGGTIDYGLQGVPDYECQVWDAFRTASQGYVHDVGSLPPYGQVAVEYGAPTAGVPFSPYDETWWPSNYPTMQDGTSVAQHEFGHTFRHKFDGSLAHFAYDAARFWYLQNHSDTSCSDTNAGFAFNEGWAEFWAGDVHSPCTDPTDYGNERNVAAALRALQNRCSLSRGQMVGILAAHPGTIHSFPEFNNAAGKCTPRLAVGAVTAATAPPLQVNPKTVTAAGATYLAGLETRIATLQKSLTATTSTKPAPCQAAPCRGEITAVLKTAQLESQIALLQSARKEFAPLGISRTAVALANEPTSEVSTDLSNLRSQTIKSWQPVAQRYAEAALTALQRLPGRNADKTDAIAALNAILARIKAGNTAAFDAFDPTATPSSSHRGTSSKKITVHKIVIPAPVIR